MKKIGSFVLRVLVFAAVPVLLVFGLPAIGAEMVLDMPALERQTFKKTCGPSKFEMVVFRTEHGNVNKYVLYAVLGEGNNASRKQLYSDEGAMIDAACLRLGPGKDYLVFDSNCGGSGCVEGRYGVIEANSLKVLILPPKKNVRNTKAAEAKVHAPLDLVYINADKFCCADPKWSAGEPPKVVVEKLTGESPTAVEQAKK